MDVSATVKQFIPDPNRQQLYMLAGVLNTAIERTESLSRKERLQKRIDSLLKAADETRLPRASDREAVEQLAHEIHVANRGVRVPELTKEISATINYYLEALRFVAHVTKQGSRPWEPIQEQMPANPDLRQPSTRIDEHVAGIQAQKRAEFQSEQERYKELRRKMGYIANYGR